MKVTDVTATLNAASVAGQAKWDQMTLAQRGNLDETSFVVGFITAYMDDRGMGL